MKTSKDVLKAIKDNDVKYVDFRFTDPRGKWQHLTYDVTMVDDELLDDGIHVRRLVDRRLEAINESDMLLKPDPASATMDPFFAAATIVDRLRCARSDLGPGL